MKSNRIFFFMWTLTIHVGASGLAVWRPLFIKKQTTSGFSISTIGNSGWTFGRQFFRVEIPKLVIIQCCIFSPCLILAQRPQGDAKIAAILVNIDKLYPTMSVTQTTVSFRVSSAIVAVIRITLHWINWKRHVLENRHLRVEDAISWMGHVSNDHPSEIVYPNQAATAVGYHHVS
jgi:hypothetical protein